MKPTGLPSLPALDDRRAWELWTRAVVERVKREASVSALSGDQQRGRVEGAQRVVDLLISSLPDAHVAE